MHSAHWFLGNFIPQIPAAFIQILSRPGEIVLDPFGGSGTTAIEASKLGRRAILSDRISASVMIGSGKVALQRIGIDAHIRASLISELTWEYQCRTDQVGRKGEGSDPELKNWYSPETLSQLRFLWLLVERQETAHLRKILTLIFSDVLFACASAGTALTSTGKRRRHHWGWIADNVRPRDLISHNAVHAFEARLAALPMKSALSDCVDTLIIQQDASNIALNSESVDLIVTSPPYISVIDYTLANRLLYTWMGWPMDIDRRSEIGARFKRGRKQAVEEYLTEMSACWSELHRVLKPGGHCAVVIGESRRYPGTVKRTLENLESLMPCVWGPVERRPSRRRVSERGAREAIEYLCVMRKR